MLPPLTRFANAVNKLLPMLERWKVGNWRVYVLYKRGLKRDSCLKGIIIKSVVKSKAAMVRTCQSLAELAFTPMTRTVPRCDGEETGCCTTFACYTT